MSIDTLAGIEQIIISNTPHSVILGEKNFYDYQKKSITLTSEFLKQCDGDMQCATECIKCLQYDIPLLTNSSIELRSLASVHLINPKYISRYQSFLWSLEHIYDPFTQDPLIQLLLLRKLIGGVIHPELLSYLKKPIDIECFDSQSVREWRKNNIDKNGGCSLGEGLDILYTELQRYDIYEEIDKKITSKGSTLGSLLAIINDFVTQQGIKERCDILRKQQQELKHAHHQQIQHHLKQQQDKSQQGILFEGLHDIPATYDPRNSNKDMEGSETLTVIGVRSPPITGYFTEQVGHHFGSNLKWTTDQSPKAQLHPQHDITPTHTLLIQLAGNKATLPKPEGMYPVGWTNGCKLSIGYDGQIILIGDPGGSYEIQRAPISAYEDNQIITYPSDDSVFLQPLHHILPGAITKWLSDKSGEPDIQLSSVAAYIRSKIYSTKFQGTYHETSRTSDEYLEKLRNASKLECYSANHLMVALARYLGFPARLALGYHSHFTHHNQSMICKNDGHAWAEIFIDGVRQRWDVTPTITDPDDPIQSEQVLDEKDPLDITTEQSHNMSLKKQLLAILKAEYQHSAPEVKITDIQAQLREGISLSQAKMTYDLLNKNHHRTQVFAQLLRTRIEEWEHRSRTFKTHSRRMTGNIDQSRFMNNIKLVLGDLQEHQKLINEELPIRKISKTQTQEQMSLPDELHLHVFIDVSGSMDSYFDSVKNDLVMIWDAFRHIARSSRTAGMETLVHITAFGTHYEHVAYKGSTILPINGDDSSLGMLSYTLSQIQSGNNGFQNKARAGGGNSENNLYKHYIQLRYPDYQKEQLSNKKSKHIGFSFTDQQTLTDESDFSATTIRGIALPAQTKQQRLESYLGILADLGLPIIAINYTGEAKGDSGYADYIAGGPDHTTSLPEKLFEQIKRVTKRSVEKYVS